MLNVQNSANNPMQPNPESGTQTNPNQINTSEEAFGQNTEGEVNNGVADIVKVIEDIYNHKDKQKTNTIDP